MAEGAGSQHSSNMEMNRQPEPRKTLFTAVAVLVMLAIAVIGLAYSIHLIWTLPPKP